MGNATYFWVHDPLTPPIPRRSRPVLAFFCGVIWLALLAGGSALMLRYDYTAGTAGQAPTTWPAASGIPRAPNGATLVMLAHPKCPCSRASIEELAALMAESKGTVTAHVLFFKPEGASDDWTHTAQWQAASAIPGVTVGNDEAGAEAKRFGGETSGDVLLYDAGGRLAFHGGVTAARGHVGANAGHTSLAALLRGTAPAKTRTPVFGCPLSTGPTPCPLHP